MPADDLEVAGRNVRQFFFESSFNNLFLYILRAVCQSITFKMLTKTIITIKNNDKVIN